MYLHLQASSAQGIDMASTKHSLNIKITPFLLLLDEVTTSNTDQTARCLAMHYITL